MGKIAIAVIGTGRSGTHMLGHLIDTSKNVTASIEDSRLFPLITDIATHGATTDKVMQVNKLLEDRIDSCETKFYLEKSHPLMWCASNPVINELPVKFIGIKRDPFAVVASMMKHKGTRSWSENWNNLPLPNAFLGITEEVAEEYANMDIVERCIMRWISHTRELERLQYVLAGDRYLLINYEELVNNPKQTLKKVGDFTGIKDIDKSFNLQPESLDKWKSTLDARQVRLVARAIIKHGREYAESVL